MRKKPYQDPYSWSKTSSETMTFEEAEKYCKSLSENGFDDWHLPTLHEIRTLADKCVAEENQDFCELTDSCEWNNCAEILCGKCVKYDDSVDYGTFWTRTPFHKGKVFVFTISEETEENQVVKSETHLVKCVRRAVSS